MAREITQAGGRVLVIPTDVRQEAAVEAPRAAGARRVGRVDALVNAAGVATSRQVTDSKLDDSESVLAVNLRGAVLCCRAVLPAMIAQRRGTVINVGLGGDQPHADRQRGLHRVPSTGCSASPRVLAEEMRAQGSGAACSGGRRRHPAMGRHARGAGWERMLRPDQVAEVTLLMASLDPNATLEEVTLLPAGGIL